MDTIYTKAPAPSTSHNTLSFAEQAAAAELGRHYVHPLDREFRDRPPPNWKKLGSVTDGIVDRLHRRRDQHEADLEKIEDPV